MPKKRTKKQGKPVPNEKKGKKEGPLAKRIRVLEEKVGNLEKRLAPMQGF